ncbi:MAG: hypothetical protein OES78_06995 [Chromatiales bacterium]|nr:hypothetical protein [Chromatiales bacterium]
MLRYAGIRPARPLPGGGLSARGPMMPDSGDFTDDGSHTPPLPDSTAPDPIATARPRGTLAARQRCRRQTNPALALMAAPVICIVTAGLLLSGI